MRDIFSSYFKFNSSDRSGAWKLAMGIGLFLIILAYPAKLWNNSSPAPPRLPAETAESICQKQLPDSLRKYPSYCQIFYRKSTMRPFERVKKKNKLYEFNPNELSMEEALELGFGHYAATSLMNYLAKGGIIRHKEDLMKLYGMDEKKFIKLKPFIILDEKEEYYAKKWEEIREQKRLQYLYARQDSSCRPYARDTSYYTRYNKDRRYYSRFRKDSSYYSRYSKDSSYARRSGNTYAQRNEWSDSSFKNKPYTFCYNPSDSSYALRSRTNRDSFYYKKRKYDTIRTGSLPGKKPAYKPKKINIVDINTASLDELKNLPLIGEKRAADILHLRDKLGGFSTEEQLRLMKNMPDSVIQIIRPYLRFSSFIAKKININTATKEDMKGHPAFPYKIARAIINYREQHGPYKMPEDLLKCYLINEKAYELMLPYIILE